MFRRTPYVVAAAMQFEQRLAAMPDYYARTLWLYECLKAYQQLTPNPAAPQSNMLHLYLPVSKEKATEARNAVARDHGIWLFGNAVNTALPDQCMFEWYVGDQLLAMPDAEVRRAIDLLVAAIARQAV